MFVNSSDMVIFSPKPENFPDYYQVYFSYVKENNLLVALENATRELQTFLASVPAEKENFRYAPGKWLLKEVTGHICDTERILTYRALCFARNEKKPLPAFDENSYVAHANFKSRTLPSIAAELLAVRKSSNAFFHSLDKTDFDKAGFANNRSYTARDMLFMVIAHQRHHVRMIEERYLT